MLLSVKWMWLEKCSNIAIDDLFLEGEIALFYYIAPLNLNCSCVYSVRFWKGAD